MKKNLLYFVFGNVEMAKESTERLIEISPDEHYRKMLLDDLKEYNAFYERILQTKTNDEELKGLNPVVKFSSDMSITMQTSNDKSNQKLSEMLVKGFEMGIKDAKENIEKAKLENERTEVINLAKDYQKLLEDNVRKYSKMQ